MKDVNLVLADLPGLGRVRMCSCNAIHLNIGPVTLNLQPEAFAQATTLMNMAMAKLAQIESAKASDRESLGVLPVCSSTLTH